MNKNYIIAIVVGAVILYFVFSKKPEKKKNVEVEQEFDCPDGTNNTLYNCDCNGNVVDVCGVCGGGQTDPALCEGVVDDDGNPSGEEGTMTYDGRTYTTQVITYPNGDQLEWMTDNFKAMNSLYYITNPVGNTNNACCIYGMPENMQQGIVHNYFQEYGGLYNHNYARNSNNIPAVDGWRLPTETEFLSLLEMNDYQMDDLCSITGWDAQLGLEGTNQGLVNLQGGGFVKNLSGVTGSFISQRGYYLIEDDEYNAGIRKHVDFNPAETFFNVTSSSNFASIRLVRVPAP
tara:strand:- start:403 stop:1269 length:867 start_codon:yes stop_codon:yes gene_type:complete